MSSMKSNSNILIKECKLETVQYFTKILQDAAWQVMPERKNTLSENYNIPFHIKKLFQEKRRACGKWQETHSFKQPSTELYAD